ncbi:serine hydrolase domain-containing protein [Streptacidiphilus neutrinimicus]|uniref:serine hydrolase domain-containing protein n=1 Tax=Streptacidiphilus neutrinimicus TaxID=105420 RepID=UPI0005A7DC3C|nr:serine hydrolase domain-containing protein [Streptacidiphilus neutrinimicus]
MPALRRPSGRRFVAAMVALAAAGSAVLAGPSVQAVERQTGHVAAGRSADDCRLDPALVARLDKAIRATMKETGTPGVTVGLWLPERGDYVRSFGVADKATAAPMRPGLFMRIGSETKTFTATAVLELVDQGLIKLDAPVARYLRGVPDGRHITIRQLLEMRSGLFPYSADPDFIKAFLADPYRQWTPQELLSYAFRHKNVFPPGAMFQYSNTNYVLLGLLVEKYGRMPLADFVRERILKPSHLDHTLFPTGAEFPAPHAHGYTNQTPTGAVADATHWNPSAAWAAGAMVSDLHDMRLWAKDVATGTLLSPATQAERVKFIPAGFPDAGYGLGLFETAGWQGHNGSIPGYQSAVVYLPQEDATLVVLLNTDISNNGAEPSTRFANAITSLATPNHVYNLPATG